MTQENDPIRVSFIGAMFHALAVNLLLLFVLRRVVSAGIDIDSAGMLFQNRFQTFDCIQDSFCLDKPAKAKNYFSIKFEQLQGLLGKSLSERNLLYYFISVYMQMLLKNKFINSVGDDFSLFGRIVVVSSHKCLMF